MKKPKISIITIAYNSEKTIEETILSIVNQDYDNLEYIIIDGMSSDNTLDIIKKYSDRISFYISEPDNGISDAFNKGISYATGDIIGLINSDDKLLPNALNKVAEYFDGKTYIYKGDIILCDTTSGYKCREKASIKFPLMPFFCHVAHQGMFATPKCYKEIGGYDVKMKFAMDLDFLIRATTMNVPFMKMDVDVAEFRSGGVTGSNSVFKKKKEFIYMIKKNGGSTLQAMTYYYYILLTQVAKMFLNIFGDNLGQKLRYHKANNK